MDPATASTLIKVGGSLLGGLLGKKKTVSAQENSRQGILGQAQGAREAADQYGFNPLTLLGASSAIGPSQQDNTMGQAIADASMLAADSLAGREEEKLRLENMRLENERLKAEVTNLTLRPKVGGIYARNVATPVVTGIPGGQDVRSADGAYTFGNLLSDPVDYTPRDGGGIAVPDQRLDRGSGVVVGSHLIQSAPGWSPSDRVETEWGDVGQAFYGVAKLGADLNYTAEQDTKAQDKLFYDTRSNEPWTGKDKATRMREWWNYPPSKVQAFKDWLFHVPTPYELGSRRPERYRSYYGPQLPGFRNPKPY